MAPKVGFLRKRPRACLAGEWSLSCVDADVGDDIRSLREVLLANQAAKPSTTTRLAVSASFGALRFHGQACWRVGTGVASRIIYTADTSRIRLGLRLDRDETKAARAPCVLLYDDRFAYIVLLDA
eukprot:1328165-Amorphochlora_amoeboformis.AAC.1